MEEFSDVFWAFIVRRTCKFTLQKCSPHLVVTSITRLPGKFIKFIPSIECETLHSTYSITVLEAAYRATYKPTYSKPEFLNNSTVKTSDDIYKI